MWIADIAAAEPVAKERGRGFLRILPVTRRDLRAAQADFAILAGAHAISPIVADFDLNLGNGAPGRSDLCDLKAGLHKRIAAARFGKPIRVDVTRIGEILREGANA